MNKVEQTVYDLLMEAKETAYNVADFEVSAQIRDVLRFMFKRAESRRTGKPIEGE